MKWKKWIFWFVSVSVLMYAALDVQSQTKLEPAFRGELTSDSTVTVTSVEVVIQFGTQVDTFPLQALDVDSLDWDTTKIDLDSAGIYTVTYLVYYSDGQVVPYGRSVTTLGSATISAGDKADIASYVADTLLARGFPSSGTGNTRCSVFVRDTVNDVNVAGVDVYIYNSSGLFVTWNETVAGGYVIFNLDSLVTYLLRPSRTGYVLPVEDTFVVASGGPFVDTIQGYLFSPGPAPSAYQHNVWGWFYDISGSGKSGILVEAKLNRNIASLTNSGVLLTKYMVTDTTDTSGYWQLTLVDNDSISPSGTYYKLQAYDSARLIGGVSRQVTSEGMLDWTR